MYIEIFLIKASSFCKRLTNEKDRFDNNSPSENGGLLQLLDDVLTATASEFITKNEINKKVSISGRNTQFILLELSSEEKSIPLSLQFSLKPYDFMSTKMLS